MHIVLVEPDIAPNVGNIARLCVATETTLHLVRPLGFQLTDRRLKRAGLDYWEHLSLKIWDDFSALQKHAPSARFFLFSSKAQRLYTDITYGEDDYLIFGSESSGLPAALRGEYRDSLLTIPMWGKVRCLNVAHAAGIALYEALRQLRIAK